jgi:hypothetical protein
MPARQAGMRQTHTWANGEFGAAEGAGASGQLSER